MLRREQETPPAMVSESKAALRQAESMKESWNFCAALGHRTDTLRQGERGRKRRPAESG